MEFSDYIEIKVEINKEKVAGNLQVCGNSVTHGSKNSQRKGKKNMKLNENIIIKFVEHSLNSPMRKI